MGQGLHTKMIQVCSRSLGIPVAMIYINDTSTATVANMTPTAASMSSDIYGMAILNACDVLNDRLAPVKNNNPSLSWEEWVRVEINSNNSRLLYVQSKSGVFAPLNAFCPTKRVKKPRYAKRPVFDIHNEVATYSKSVFLKVGRRAPGVAERLLGAGMQQGGAGGAIRRFRKRNKDTTSCQNNDTIFLNIN